jgi:hypothetical protein
MYSVWLSTCVCFSHRALTNLYSFSLYGVQSYFVIFLFENGVLESEGLAIDPQASACSKLFNLAICKSYQ